MNVAFLSGAGSYLALNARLFRSKGAIIRSAAQCAEEYADHHELGARLAKESNVSQKQ
jgi:hypothetical protein